MNLNVALTVAKNVGWNTLVGTGHLAAGFAVATAVNSIACRIFNPKPGETLDIYIKFFATAAGIAVALHYAPQAALISFTANQALKLIAAVTVFDFVSTLALKKNFKLSPLVTIGAMTGYFGAPFLTAFAGAGAAAGARLFTAFRDR